MEKEDFKRFEEAMEAAQIAWWEMKLPSGDIRFGANKATMLGYDPKDFTHYKHFTELVDPADYENMMQDMRDHMEGKKNVYETMYRIKCADGTQKQFYDRGKIVDKDGDDIVIRGFVVNVNNIQEYAYSITQPLRERAEELENGS